MSATAVQSNLGVTLANMDVINHLLFHKAIVDPDEDTSRINKYLSLVKEGEHVSLHDPFDRSIALVFDLVVQEQLNVWDVDLVKFSQLYLQRAKEQRIDLVTAGRIILMAWTVLKLQSDDLVKKFERRQQETEEVDAWGAIPDWHMSGDELDYTQRVLQTKRPIDEKIWHEGDRPVTLMELVNAFETAREEAEKRTELNKLKEEFKARLKAEGITRFHGRVHREDLEEDIRLIWERICSLNGSAIDLRQVCDPKDLWDFVTAFNSVLFLHRDQKIQLWQDNFPYGPIQMRNLLAAGGLSHADESHAPTLEPEEEVKEEPAEATTS